MMNATQRSNPMAETKIYMRISDRVLAKLVKEESENLRTALGAHNYDDVRKWARELSETLKEINNNLEARK
jgi:hypothetical protein